VKGKKIVRGGLTPIMELYSHENKRSGGRTFAWGEYLG